MLPIYIIESVRHRDGSVHEREARRKGHRVQMMIQPPFNGMYIAYIDEVDSIARTSAVESVINDGNKRIVTTSNSVYTFVKEAPTNAEV